MIHLDHAATSFPKPPEVLAAVQHWFADVGVSPARGDGDRQQMAAIEFDAVRRLVGDLTGLSGPRIAFVSGATEGLNLALRAMLQTGDTVLTTAFEHSSIARPLAALRRERGLRIAILPPRADGSLPAADFAAALAELRPSLLVFTHASNVTGSLFDAAAICRLARGCGSRTLLDASQTAGICNLRVDADVIVASAHKALHGPPGLGFVAAAPHVALAAQKQGGTGSSVALGEHPTDWPTAFEAGTPNSPAIFGLGAALRWLAAVGQDSLAERSHRHLAALREALQGNPAIRVLPQTADHVPLLSFVHASYDPAELGALFAAAGITVRSGYHCAPWIHEHFGTPAGTVRLSPGPLLDEVDLAAALAVITSL